MTAEAVVAATQADGAVPVAGRRVPSYAWLVLAVVFVAGVTTALTQFEAPPLLTSLMHWFRVDLSSASSLVSVFAITGAVVALPSAYVLRRLGATFAGVVALGAVAVGGGLGALSPNFGLLLASRAIEGLGLGLIAVVAPTVIAAWFPTHARGAAMGLWATWIPLGGVLMFNIAPRVGGSSDWQAVWWLGALIALVALVLFGLMVRLPAGTPSRVRQSSSVDEGSLLRIALSNRSIWILAIAFCLFNTGQAVASSFYPTFLVDERGLSASAASTMGSLLWIASVPSCLLGGFISDRLGSRKLVYTVPAVLMGLAWLVAFSVHGWEIPLYLVVAGLLTGAVATATWTAVPEVMGRHAAIGVGMAILMFGQSLGFVIGPIIFSHLVEGAGWLVAGWVWVPLALVAAVVGWLVRVR